MELPSYSTRVPTRISQHRPKLNDFCITRTPLSFRFCVDTGDIKYCGGDSVAIIEHFSYRVVYVHLKQVDVSVLKEVSGANITFGEVVRRGVVCEPPNGILAMRPVISALEKCEVDLFAIAELYGCHSDPTLPLDVASRTRSYFAALGVPGSALSPERRRK
jgi:inosose dehydratase